MTFGVWTKNGSILRSPSAVSMGNPHAIFWVGDPAAYDLAAIGPKLEHDPLFPERANITLAATPSRERVVIRTWERGAGLTAACGSAACAAAVAAAGPGAAAVPAAGADCGCAGGTLAGTLGLIGSVWFVAAPAAVLGSIPGELSGWITGGATAAGCCGGSCGPLLPPVLGPGVEGLESGNRGI